MRGRGEGEGQGTIRERENEVTCNTDTQTNINTNTHTHTHTHTHANLCPLSSFPLSPPRLPLPALPTTSRTFLGLPECSAASRSPVLSGSVALCETQGLNVYRPGANCHELTPPQPPAPSASRPRRLLTYTRSRPPRTPLSMARARVFPPPHGLQKQRRRESLSKGPSPVLTEVCACRNVPTLRRPFSVFPFLPAQEVRNRLRAALRP